MANGLRRSARPNEQTTAEEFASRRVRDRNTSRIGALAPAVDRLGVFFARLHPVTHWLRPRGGQGCSRSSYPCRVNCIRAHYTSTRGSGILHRPHTRVGPDAARRRTGPGAVRAGRRSRRRGLESARRNRPHGRATMESRSQGGDVSSLGVPVPSWPSLHCAWFPPERSSSGVLYSVRLVAA